jgi:MYXO-CTERM domain-containing protein
MKTSRITAAVVATLALFAADRAAAQNVPTATGETGATAVLNTYSKVWVVGDTMGPNKLGKLTGAGLMDPHFAWDNVAYAKDKSSVKLLTVYTRADDQANGNNSYLQGGFAAATLDAQGVHPGAEVKLPRLNGDRTFMRPLVAPLPGDRALLIAASEDNGVNNNPQPVAYVVSTGPDAKILSIPNSTRGANNINKPTNLIVQAGKNGIAVNNPQNQRGPHTINCVSDNTCIVGMQYNNQAQEAFSITVNADNSVKMNWLQRYSNTAQHCRPSVAVAPGMKSGFLAAVEANEQPAEIGFRVTEFNVDTGKPIQSKIVVRSEPGKNRYISEPVLSLLNDGKLAVTYGLAAKVRAANNGEGHAGGKKVDAAALINKSDLTLAGPPEIGVGQYGRHNGSYTTAYGPNGDPALAVIGGSSTGTGGGFVQIYPLNAEGKLGVKDPMKVYQASPYSDVANVQARGKRNPNNQARGFINGVGSVPNPGFTSDPAMANKAFMPETKQFSFSVITGYTDAAGAEKGLKNSLWLSLVPAQWQDGLKTVPGKATDAPGTGEGGLGPAPLTTSPGTDPTGEATNSPGVGGDVVPDGEDNATRPNAKTRAFDAGTNEGCAVSSRRSSNSSSGTFGLVGLAIAGVLVALRRKRGEV